MVAKRQKDQPEKELLKMYLVITNPKEHLQANHSGSKDELVFKLLGTVIAFSPRILTQLFASLCEIACLSQARKLLLSDQLVKIASLHLMA